MNLISLSAHYWSYVKSTPIENTVNEFNTIPNLRCALGKIEPLLPVHKTYHPLGTHRKRVDNRDAMNGIHFVFRTGCQWNALNATGICTSSSVHRHFQEWRDADVFGRF